MRSVPKYSLTHFSLPEITSDYDHNTATVCFFFFRWTLSGHLVVISTAINTVFEITNSIISIILHRLTSEVSPGGQQLPSISVQCH